ncbi:MAG: 50S ribosomal protein L24 [Chloroflexi bacterium]|nr:50S ribosomal protein L24 [Chloroflexota bacterium]MCL5074960.1 50S ribosomal protein L24 [Chloroflexota bacterium]
MKVKKDDTVLVLSGRDKGKRGKVHRVLPKENKVLVSGINIIKKHTKPRGTARQAGIIEREAPIHISNVAVVCDKCNRATRVGYRFLSDGKKVRFCKSCSEIIS